MIFGHFFFGLEGHGRFIVGLEGLIRFLVEHRRQKAISVLVYSLVEIIYLLLEGLRKFLV
jgi:hypothetical protein